MPRNDARVWACILASALCLAFLPRPLQAADAGGQFAIKGAGLASCQQSLEARGSEATINAAARGWVQGYLTAVNRYEPQTYDAAPWGTPEVLAAILANHCRTSPDERFVDAVQKMVVTLKKDRLTTSSQLMNISASGKQTLVYAEILKRVQVQLAERGLYLGAADGVFGPKTQEAIAMFQVSEGLEGTGLPDPLTVWKLVSP